MEIIVSDFDGVLFKRNHGLIRDVVDYLNNQQRGVYIVTYRAPDQKEFILSQVQDEINLVGIAFADSRKKDPQTKVRLVQDLMLKYTIVHALDNDESVVVLYNSIGIPTSLVTNK